MSVAFGLSLSERSRLHLAFELVQEAPIGALGDDLLRARLDEARFVQTQGIESDRVLGVVFPPFVVRQPAERLQRVIVSFVKPPSTSSRAARAGSVAHKSAALRMARVTRLVAIGYFRTNSRWPASMQQKYCDQGRSTVLSTITWPTRRACNSCGSGGKPRKPSSFPSMKSCIGFTDGLTTQLMSLLGSIPTCAAIGARNICWGEPNASTPIDLPRKSAMPWTSSLTNSSKHPACRPANTVTGIPRSIAWTQSGAKSVITSKS